MILSQKTSWITIANEQIKIADVLTNLGIHVQVAGSNGTSKKLHCPFGEVYHSDSGYEKTMRVFQKTNSAYCFRCNQSYDPVSLAAVVWDVSRQNAALRLLEASDFKPKSLEERWSDAVRVPTIAVDLLSLADALKVYCSGISPDWNVRQLDDQVGSKLNACLALLSAVKTDTDAVKWLEVCKQVMSKVLERS
jgi:hypothetical protein